MTVLSTSRSNKSILLGILSLSITGLRIIMAIFSAYLLENNIPIQSSIFVFAIMMLDHFDGQIFKKSRLNMYEKWRKIRRIFDSCADRVVIQIVCLTLLAINPAFITCFFCIIFKELLTSILCISYFHKGILLNPPKIAKISTIAIGLLAISNILDLPYAISAFLCLLVLLTGIRSAQKYRENIEA